MFHILLFDHPCCKMIKEIHLFSLHVAQLENGYTFHDYNIKLNDVIQLMVKVQPEESTEKTKDSCLEKETESSKKGDESLYTGA